MYSTYESTVKEIIGIDGIHYDYVEQVEPADPPERAELVVIERWKPARKKYEAAPELLIKDCAKLYGVLLGQKRRRRRRLTRCPRVKVLIFVVVHCTVSHIEDNPCL